MQTPLKKVSVSGLWLRIIDGKIQILAETEHRWRLLMEESLADHNPTFSHIYEPSGILSAPVDPLMAMTYERMDKMNDTQLDHLPEGSH